MPNSTTAKPRSTSSSRRRPPGPRMHVRARGGKGGRPRGSVSSPGWLARDLERKRKARDSHRARKSLRALERDALPLLPKAEVESLARECGFYQRQPKAIEAFSFALCCAMAALAEGKRGFASVWRLLSAAAGVEVARSAVTQRFGDGSAKLMEELFVRAVARLPATPTPELLSRLEEFREVLADDGSVVTLSPLLRKLFPATRTNCVEAAGKVHATADLVRRRVVAVEVTGERESELAVARSHPPKPGVLYMRDLGYTSYDHFAEIKEAQAHLLYRLKDNANPTIVAVRHGILAPAETVRQELGLNSPKLRFTVSRSTFDVDARFETKNGCETLRVVGLFNPATDKYHCYVTTLSPENWTPEDLAALYSLRWVIELLFKLLKSSCHLDHLDTSDPGALRTHIYASLLAATILSSVCHAAANAEGMQVSIISAQVAGIAAPLIVMPLMWLYYGRSPTFEELADSIVRVIAFGCRNQNPKRTRLKWEKLGHQ